MARQGLEPGCHLWRAGPYQAAESAPHREQRHGAGGQEPLESGLVGPRGGECGNHAVLPIVPPYCAYLCPLAHAAAAAVGPHKQPGLQADAALELQLHQGAAIQLQEGSKLVAVGVARRGMNHALCVVLCKA
jgi:hypothetical protein